ncbi:MAG: alpha/beta fold hydrolase [Burkholderiaceae bacterium]
MTTEALPMNVVRRGAGAPLLLLHGFCGSAAGWAGLAQRLSARFDVIAPDWPGFGASVRCTPCRSIEAMAGELIALADALGLARFHVLGHSMSGFVVQQLLLQHGDRVDKAVLYGAGLSVRHGGRFESLSATIERLRRDGSAATARGVCATWFVEQQQAAPYEFCVEQGAAMDVDAGIAALEACETVDFSGRLAAVANPVLVMLGDRDRTFQVDDAVRLAAALPDAGLCVLPHCAHGAHWERPEAFELALTGFLDL